MPYFVQAIALAELIHPDHSLFLEASTKRQLWAKEILERAKNKLEKGKPEEGIQMLKSVPRWSYAFQEAQFMLVLASK